MMTDSLRWMGSCGHFLMGAKAKERDLSHQLAKERDAQRYRFTLDIFNTINQMFNNKVGIASDDLEISSLPQKDSLISVVPCERVNETRNKKRSEESASHEKITLGKLTSFSEVLEEQEQSLSEVDSSAISQANSANLINESLCTIYVKKGRETVVVRGSLENGKKELKKVFENISKRSQRQVMPFSRCLTAFDIQTLKNHSKSQLHQSVVTEILNRHFPGRDFQDLKTNREYKERCLELCLEIYKIDVRSCAFFPEMFWSDFGCALRLCSLAYKLSVRLQEPLKSNVNFWRILLADSPLAIYNAPPVIWFDKSCFSLALNNISEREKINLQQAKASLMSDRAMRENTIVFDL